MSTARMQSSLTHFLGFPLLGVTLRYRYVAPMELEEKNVPKKSRRDDISVEYRPSPSALPIRLPCRA